MKSIKTVSVLCVGVLIFISCRNPLSGNINNDSFEFGEEFEIEFERQAINNSENVTVTFSEIMEDGRCPADVMCFWAGNAAISVQIEVNTEPQNIELNTHRNLKTENYFDGYKISLIKLDPYPQSIEKPIPEKDYTATLLVEKSN